MGVYCNCVRVRPEEKVFFYISNYLQEEFSFIDVNRSRENLLKSINKNSSIIDCNENMEKNEELDIKTNDMSKVKLDVNKNNLKNALLLSSNSNFILLNKPVRI